MRDGHYTTKELKKAHKLHLRYASEPKSFKAFVREYAQQLSPRADYKQESIAWLERKGIKI